MSKEAPRNESERQTYAPRPLSSSATTSSAAVPAFESRFSKSMKLSKAVPSPHRPSRSSGARAFTEHAPVAEA